jgi:hypothetical protein
MLYFPDIHVLIEMTGKPDCRFIGSWLLKAAEAQSFWSQALRDPAFEAATSALCTLCQPNLECAALETLTALRQQDPPFHGYAMHFVLAIDLCDWESGAFSVEFAMMVQLGFFTLASGSYRMTVPESVTLKQVQQAALKVASTEADGDGAKPERLLHILPQADAEASRCTRLALRRAGFKDS